MVVAGEASGDHHAADLVRALRRKMPGLTCFGMGGAALAAAGQEQLVDSGPLSVMGLAEVVSTLGKARAALKCLTAAMAQRRPAAVILVDYPDFNMRLARAARRQGHRVIYFISPQIWAWRSQRVRALARDVDLMLCILPFEPEFYREHQVPARFAGHPLMDQAQPGGDQQEVRSRLGLPAEGPILALLPGSRRQELRGLLPEMLEAVRRLTLHPGLAAVVLPVAPGLGRSAILQAAGPAGLPASVHLVQDVFYQAIAAADLALVASGTATLAAAVVGTPMVMGYRLNPLTWVPIRYLTNVSDAALVNLVAGHRLVPELLQDDWTAENLVREARLLLASPERRRQQQAGFAAVRERLGPPGAVDRAAAMITRTLAGQQEAVQTARVPTEDVHGNAP